MWKSVACAFFGALATLASAQALQSETSQSHSPKTPSLEETFWMIGIHLSDASRLAASGERWSVVKTQLDSAVTLAKSSGLQLPSFPSHSGDALSDSRALMRYGLTTTRTAIADSIRPGASTRPLALYDVALRSGLLLVVYRPGAQEVVSFVSFVENNAELAGIPAEIWKPFVTGVRGAKSYDEVQKLVVLFHGRGQIYIATGSVGAPTSEPRVEETVWSLGSIWAGAVVQGQGAVFEQSWQTVETMAALVGIEPRPPSASATTMERLQYLVNQRNKGVEKLLDRYGKSQAALFELAMTLPMVELQYSPGGELAKSTVRFIRETAPMAGVPTALFDPLIQKLDAGASLHDVQSTRWQVVIDVGDHLVRNR